MATCDAHNVEEVVFLGRKGDHRWYTTSQDDTALTPFANNVMINRNLVGMGIHSVMDPICHKVAYIL